MVNHLQMSYYHLGLVCSQCLKYLTTSMPMLCTATHWQLCKLAVVGVNDNDQEGESDTNDDGEDDLKFS